MAKILKKPKAPDIGGNKATIMKLNIFLDRYFNILMTVFLIFIFLIGVFFIIIPKYESIASNIKSVSEAKNAEYDILEDQYVKIRAIWSEYQAISKSNKDRINKMLPGREEAEELFRELSPLIIKTGLEINTIEIIPDDVNQDAKTASKDPGILNNNNISGLGKINIKLELNGADYNKFKNLLSVFEQNLHIMDIENLNVSLGEGAVSMDLVSYYLKN